MAIGPSGNTGFTGLSRERTQPTPVPLTGKYVEIYKRTRVITQPVNEPITLDELKAHLRITTNDENTYLTGLIQAARVHIEEYLRRKLITQTIRMTLDQWPFFDFPVWEGQVEAPFTALVPEAALKLWFPPLQSVSQVQITFRDGTTTIYASSNYLVDNSTPDDYGRITLKVDATIVTNLQEINAVEIDYVAGYGVNGSDVPFAIRQALLNYAAWMYQNRGDCSDGKVSYIRGETPLDVSGAAGYLVPYRIERLQN